jgi:hypothetical protein
LVAVVVQFNDVVHCSAHRLDRQLDVFKALLDLRWKVVRANQVSTCGSRYLSGDMHEGAASRLHNVWIANGWGNVAGQRKVVDLGSFDISGPLINVSPRS